MQKVLIVSVFTFVIVVFVFAEYETADPPENCLVGELVGACVPLPACTYIVTRLRDSGGDRDALNLAHSRKCGFAGLNMKVCCLGSERIVDTLARFVVNKTSSGGNTKTTQLGSYVEGFEKPPECGRGSLFMDDEDCVGQILTGQIVAGGIPFNLGDAPWMALLGYTPSTSFWECGGSIITRRHILTAAHCIDDRLSLVRIGELDLEIEEDGAFPEDYLVKNMVAHEEYDKQTHVNDIGILLLDKDIEFTEFLKPICLPDLKKPTGWPAAGSMATVAGWGRIAHFGQQSTELLYADINIFETSFCQQQYRNYSRTVIDDRTICAGDLDGVKDACKGDSGGPLIVKTCTNSTGHYTQVGVVSYGLECARAGYPGVYTRVAHYMSWIRQKTTGKE